MKFEELKKTDCSKYVEKKGQFNYISWPYMVDQLRTISPSATIHARTNADGMPYFKDASGALVETYIMIDGVEVWNEWLPVMDFKNKSIKEPNSMDINKTIQRCKAKCISEYTGIGLYLYMGEDLPPDDPKTMPRTDEQRNQLINLCKQHKLDPGKVAAAYGITKETNSTAFENIYKQIENHINEGEIGPEFAQENAA